MADPHPVLYDLAAGRPMGPFQEFEAVYRSAIDHRLSGLLASQTHVVAAMPDRERAHLTGIQASMWAQNTTLLDRLRDVLALADEEGVRVGCYKGLVTEHRWYDAVGERVITDIDLLVDSRDPARAVEFVAVLDPTHPLLSDLSELMTEGVIQSVDVGYGDVRLDVHFDPLKMELLPTADLDGFWSSIETVEIEGLAVETPTAAQTLFLTLLHTMRDRFRWLGAYSDVIRIAKDPRLNWDEFEAFAAGQGFLEPVSFALRRVERTLDLRVGPSGDRGLGPVFLRAMWPERRSLAGTPLQHPPPRSTLKLAMMGKGRLMEAARAWFRRLFPPRRLLDYFHPQARGPYLLRVFTTRIGKRIRTLEQ